MALVTGTTPRRDHLHLLSSAARFRMGGYPTTLPPEEATAALSGLNAIANGLTKNALKARRKSLLSKALKNFQARWIAESYRNIQKTRGRCDITETNDAQEILQLMPENQTLAAFMSGDTPLTEETRWTAIEIGAVVLKQATVVLFRPAEAPIDESCPVCSEHLDCVPQDAQDHIHNCRRLKFQQSLPVPAKVEFCLSCSEFFSTGESWEQHCAFHLAEVPFRCGPVMYGGQLVVPGLCPFHLGCEARPSKRWVQWRSEARYREHVDQHISEMEVWPCECPHPLCHVDRQTFFSAADLRAHLHKHGMPVGGARTPRVLKRTAPAPCEQVPKRARLEQPKTVDGFNLTGEDGWYVLSKIEDVEDVKSPFLDLHYPQTIDVRQGANQAALKVENYPSPASLAESSKSPLQLTWDSVFDVATSDDDHDTSRCAACGATVIMDQCPAYASKGRTDVCLCGNDELQIWHKRGYPVIDWSLLPQRVDDLVPWLRATISTTPKFPDLTVSTTHDLLNSEKPSAEFGYYGTKGHGIV